MRTAAIVATLADAPRPDELKGIASSAEWLEVRADTAGDLDPDALRQQFSGRLLYTLPRNGCVDRRERILRAARHYDCVDLDAEDLDLFDAIPPARRVLSFRASAASGSAVSIGWSKLGLNAARFYRVVVPATLPGDELVPLELMHRLRRDDVVAYATGRIGMWTRIVAPQLGAPCVFGGVWPTLEGEGTPSVAQLVSDYDFPRVAPARSLFAIAGDPVFRSLSPRIHNAAFRAVGREALYVPFHVESFPAFWNNVVATQRLDALGLPLRAICVVSPHKEIALTAAKSRSSMAQRAGSSNFFLREADGWTADTTDPDGVMVTLRARGVAVASKRVAVIGCGGAGRAVAAALQQAGADVTLVNRGFERGSFATRLLRLPFLPLAGFSAASYALVVNATPVGRDGDGPPFAAEELHRDAVVVDLVYGEHPTPLVAGRRAKGRITIDGRDVLLTQVRSQFRLMTGEDLPPSVARDVLGITEC
jgi:3-dehydroquinate dehydratase/shikimate dehydrogenase